MFWIGTPWLASASRTASVSTYSKAILRSMNVRQSGIKIMIMLFIWIELHAYSCAYAQMPDRFPYVKLLEGCSWCYFKANKFPRSFLFSITVIIPVTANLKSIQGRVHFWQVDVSGNTECSVVGKHETFAVTKRFFLIRGENRKSKQNVSGVLNMRTQYPLFLPWGLAFRNQSWLQSNKQRTIWRWESICGYHVTDGEKSLPCLRPIAE